MKKLLLITLSVLSFTAVAQNRKIALLEPRAGEGSTNISGMEKAMVRGELRKAIVNHTGFEAFTRADIDQLMKEQDFQRTGNVSDADIHKMGEMSGADYLCISTLNKSEEEFYLEAYLINVETGAISNPASQYGELVNGKLTNMLPVCQALAQELLGTSMPIAQPVMSGSGVQIAESSAGSHTNIRQSSDNKSGIGELKVFPDGSKGVVFYLTNDGHGLVVSLDANTLKWENTSRSKDCHDIPALSNENGTPYLVFNQGLKYTNEIIQFLGRTQAPAAAWCADHGEGWYLPSAGELWYLLVQANRSADIKDTETKGGPISQAIQRANAVELTTVNGPISQALIQAGGKPLISDWYWSSTENSKSEAINVSASGSISSEDKNESILVRAVKAF